MVRFEPSPHSWKANIVTTHSHDSKQVCIVNYRQTKTFLELLLDKSVLVYLKQFTIKVSLVLLIVHVMIIFGNISCFEDKIKFLMNQRKISTHDCIYI